MRRVDDEITVDSTDTHRRDGTGERHIRQDQRRRCSDHSEHVGIILAIRRKDGDKNLHLVAIGLWKHGANHVIRETCSQCLLLAHPPFAAEEIPGDPPRGITFFTVFDREREEVAITGPL